MSTRKKKYKHVPKPVREARRAKERRRLWVGFGSVAVWWALFLIGLATGWYGFLWVGWIAVTVEFTALFGLHEKALRKLADRPQVDYVELHRLKKLEKKTRPDPLTIVPSVPDPREDAPA